MSVPAYIPALSYFVWTILMFVGRIDRTLGRDTAVRYKQFVCMLSAVLCTILAAPVVFLDLCLESLDAIVVLVAHAVRLWAQLRRILRLVLGLLLSLVWSVLVFDIVCFLVSCNIVGIVIDTAKSLFPIVWVFVTHVV